MIVLLASVIACQGTTRNRFSSSSLYPTNIASIAVPIFENKTFYRNVEFDLSDALIKEIESRTPYKVVSASEADSILVGQVRDVQQEQLSKSRLTGLTEEAVVGVTIDFEWKDQRSGKVIVDRRGFTSHGLFVPSRPLGEPLEAGERNAVQDLARGVLAEMQAQW